jgi:hypothetical protein
MQSISNAERRRRLQTRHLLTPATRTSEVTDASDAVVALHGTDPATIYLSAWARTTDLSQAEIARAMYVDKRLVRMMGMRRTMFVVASDLAPLVHASSALGVAATQRRRLLVHLKQAGVAADVERWLDEVSADTLQALAARGRATANDLAADVPALNTLLDLAPEKSYAVPQKVTSRVLTVLALQGLIVRGAVLGGWTSNRNEWWPVASWIPGGFGDLDPAAARIDLARRWLQAFGPAQTTDLAWWTGWTLGQVRTALKSIATAEVDLAGLPGIVLADDLDPTPEPSPTAALLPALDPTPMGWVEREWFLGVHRARLFDPTGNIGPTIFWRGQVVGGWAQMSDGEIRIKLLTDIGSDGAAAVGDRVDELTRWLGPLRFTPRFRTPLEKELAG